MSPRWIPVLQQLLARLSGVSMLLLCLAVTGCDQARSLYSSTFGSSEQEANTLPSEPPLPNYPEPETMKGLSREEVLEILGEPTGRFESGLSGRWFYTGYVVEFSHEGLVTLARRKKVIRRPVGVGVAKVLNYSKNGTEVDLRTLMPPGMVTVVMFHAEWCSACQALGPKIEEMVLEDPDVVLRKVDIVHFGTPVTQQHKIKAVPNFRVFNRNGILVGRETSNIQDVQDHIQNAKNRDSN